MTPADFSKPAFTASLPVSRGAQRSRALPLCSRPSYIASSARPCRAPVCACAAADGAPKSPEAPAEPPAKREYLPPGCATVPWAEGMTGADLLDIIHGRTSEEDVNTLVRTALGWAPGAGPDEWDATEVMKVWTKMYPNGPPDFVGDPNDYSRERDLPVKTAVQRLARSVPPEYKAILREVLKPLGFNGWKIDQLTPNRTRRAVIVNYLLYYMKIRYPDHVWGPGEAADAEKAAEA